MRELVVGLADALRDVRVAKLNRKLLDVVDPICSGYGQREGVRVALTACMALAVTMAQHAKEMLGDDFVEQCRKDAERLASEVLSG